MSTLDLLLKLDPPKLPGKSFKVKRLSNLCGEAVTFELTGLPFSRVAEIKEMPDSSEIPVQIVLAGVVSPDLKNPALLGKYRAATPAELVKALLLPGEIEDVSREIERLSGYRTATLEEIKKK